MLLKNCLHIFPEKIPLPLIFIVLQTLYSCEFSPQDAPLTELDPPGNPPPINISLNNGYDTLRIDWITNFTYNVTGKNRLLSVSVSFEGKEIHHYLGENSQKFSFVLDPSGCQNGIYPLNIEIITSSGTGSLAEKLGAEGYIYQCEWPVIIDNTPPEKLDFISIDSLKEGVRISWEKFDHIGFRYYKLMRTSTSYSGPLDLVTYYDAAQTSFIDTTYFEGMVVNYIIELGGKYSGLNSSTTNTIQYSQMPFMPKVTGNGDFKADLSWDPPKNIHLLDYYYIHRTKGTSSISDQDKIFEPSRIRTLPVSFGTKNYFGFLYVPKPVLGHMYTGYLKRRELEFEPGEIMPSYSYASPIHNTDNILLSRGGKIYKYNLPTGALLDSVVTNSEHSNYFTLSNDGSFFGYSENGKFITRSTSDFRLLNSMSNTAFSDNLGILLRLSISDSGRLMMILDNNVIFIFDIATGNLIAKKIFSGINWIIGAISPDGNYIVTQEYPGSLRLGYYQISGDQIVSIAGISGSGLKVFPVMPHLFGPDNDIYILFNNKVEVRNISDFSLKNTLPYSWIQYIDFDKMRAIGSNSSGSDLGYLYDLNTGSKVKDLLVYRMNQLIFHSNYLVSPDGRKMLLRVNN